MAIATQEFLEIEEIKEGIILLKNKSLRMVLMVSSINFALKSREEQDAIIFQFQNFLNSLDFPIQILVQSRRLNLTGYLERIKELEERQENELLKYQTREYRNFIQNLVKGGEIFTKNFFVIIPYFPPEISVKKGYLSPEAFERAKAQLWQRAEVVALGLKRCGLNCIPLTTLELIELFWSLYHPKEAEFGYFPEIPPELIK